MSTVLDALHAAAERVDADERSRLPGHPQVSVVVPTRGRPELLARCLIALFAQSMPRGDYEIIVVDDGRSETTRTLVEALAADAAGLAVRYLRPLGSRGPAAARNAGWNAARADLVAFTDDDTVPEPGWLAIGTAAMRAGHWAALAGRVLVPRPPGADPAPTDHERTTRGLERASFVTANAFVTRRALQRIQGFDERFRRPWREDTDLEFRLREEAGPVGRCDAAVVLHPVRPERWGVSLRQQKNACDEALLYRKHPRRYREMADGAPPWGHYAIVALTLAALVLAWLDVPGSAAVAALLALAATLRFAAQRLRGTTHAPAHVLEMLLTSFVIPFLSVGWRLRGAVRWRVWFL